MTVGYGKIKDAGKGVVTLSSEAGKEVLEQAGSRLITRSISDNITDQIIRIIESQLITPWSTLAVSGIVDKFSKVIQHNFIVDRDQNTESQNHKQKRYEELKKKEENNEILTKDEQEYIRNYNKYTTIGDQINYNAKDYCLAYTQCEAIYYAEHVKKGNNVSDELKKLAHEVRNFKPADASEMVVAANSNGIKIKLVNDICYEKTSKDIEEGVEIVYIKKGDKNEQNVDGVGHAYYMDNNGNFIDVVTLPNDCYYGVLSKILEKNGINKTVEELRIETAHAIESNSNYNNVIKAQGWISDRYPTEANSLLFRAGMYLENGKIKLHWDDPNSDDLELLKKSLVYSKRGGQFLKTFLDAVKISQSDISEDKSKNEIHHLISNREIEALLDSELKNTNKEEVAKKIENFLNQDHIKNIILGQNRFNHNLIENQARDQHGKIIHAAFSNNPHNLFHGPKNRTFDPNKPSDYADNNLRQNAIRLSRANFSQQDLLHNRSSLGHDTELLNYQSESFRASYQQYVNDKSIENFADLKENTPSKWDSNVNHGGRYEVTDVKEQN